LADVGTCADDEGDWGSGCHCWSCSVFVVLVILVRIVVL
jgi:hypothetical protein